MGIFFLLLIVYPFIELYALIKIGSAFGVFTALLGLFALSVIGASVLRRSGTKAWRKLGDEIARSRDALAILSIFHQNHQSVRILLVLLNENGEN